MADNASLQVAFRTDASLDIGTGHVMRCLTLADMLSERGADCLFLCRAHPGHLTEQIVSRGHRVITLPAPPGLSMPMFEAAPTLHAAWLGADWRDDADQCRSALADTCFDWLIVDHYALDHRWERALRPTCRQLMVMDDLADRVHDCDLLLDPSLGRIEADYAPLIPASATMLLGPHHALLRPEFAELRAESLDRRRTPALRRLLITMGGVDKDNSTGRLLDALHSTALPPDLQINVVMGSHAPWLEEVQACATRMAVATHVLVGVNDMARLMTDSDLAIGAGGGTSWERCCLGLPSFVLCLAHNQIEMGNALQEVGAAITTRSVEETAQRLHEQIATGTIYSFLERTSQAAARVTDGRGVERACHRLLA